MSYKYNEKAIVINNKNLIRLWDVAYDGYNGGKDCTFVNWRNPESRQKFEEDTYETNRPYEGVSMMVMAFRNSEDTEPWPSPILFHDAGTLYFLHCLLAVHFLGMTFCHQDTTRAMRQSPLTRKVPTTSDKNPSACSTDSATGMNTRNILQRCLTSPRCITRKQQATLLRRMRLKHVQWHFR